jgi:hypothetical protein
MAQRVRDEGSKFKVWEPACKKCEDNGWVFVRTAADASREKQNTCIPCKDCNKRTYEKWETGEIFRDVRNNDQSRRAEPRQTVSRRYNDPAYLEEMDRRQRRDLA